MSQAQKLKDNASNIPCAKLDFFFSEAFFTPLGRLLSACFVEEFQILPRWSASVIKVEALDVSSYMKSDGRRQCECYKNQHDIMRMHHDVIVA